MRKSLADDGSLEGWLQGIQQIANGAINYSKYELPKTSPIELESIDQETIKQLAIKITANSPNSELLNVKEVEEVLSGIIQRIKNFDFTKMSSSNFTKEELQQTFLSWIIFNPKVTAQQLIKTSKLTIQKFQTQEEIKEHNYFKDKYPNYESFSAHQDARAILHFLTGIPVEEISKHQAGLGITGIVDYGLNVEATYSDKWRQRTAFHDVTSTLDLKFNEESNQTNIKVPSFNKSVFGIESIVLSAITGVGIPGTIEEIFDFDLEVTTFLVDILFQLAIKPITWTTTQIDPLIVDLDNNGIKVTNLDNSLIRFDIDADGYSENVSWTNDGLLTVDLNHDGKINNITEIFSEYFKDGSANSGLEALKTYDTNNNGIISSTDTQFNQILVWQDLNQDGISQPNELKTLAQHNITSINLNAIASESIQDGNIIKKRSFFNRADGTGGEISDVAFLVTQTGFKVIQTATGIQIVAENDQAASLLIHKQTTPLNLNIATANVQVASGNTGNDTLYTTDTRNVFLSGEAGNDKLTGNSGNDWLIGGEGADQIIAGAGDDLLYIDAQDTKIDGGDGTDIAIVTTPNGITLDLGTTKLEMALGNDGNDTFTNSSAFSVTIDGGKGDDSIQGGTGKGEIDTFTGGIGRDTFILGDKTWIGYDDGNITSAGDNDYALITDFNLTDDIIQLNGSSSDYLLTVSGANTNLYINKPGNEPDELIAIINNNKALSLTASYFSYVSDTIFHTPVEAVGNTKLVKDTTNKLYTQIGNNNPIAINISGTQITTNIYPGWQTLAAETVNGVNQVLWKYNDGNYLHLWTLDSNWNWQSSTGWWGLNSSEAFTQETNFQQDFNGDGFIGQPYTPIEAFGNTKLVKDTTNKLYTQIGNNNPIAINISGTQITTNIYPGWQTLAVETVNGVNQVLWKYNDGNYLHLWSLDNNWNWQSSTGWWGLNSSEAFTQETNFQQDFNGDNQIGNPLPNIASSLAVSANVPEPIIGSSNDDIITGTADNNILIGGLGNDTLTGGAGGDQFTFNNRNEGIDTITDFLSSQGDKITVSAAGFGGGLAAGVAITTAQFVLGTTALNASNRFIYNTITGGLFFDGDGTDTLAAIQIATLSSKPTLTASDIVVLV